MTEPQHSRLGASSSHRWLHCPGSVAACAEMPNKSSIHARTGQLAHAVGEQCLLLKMDAVEFIGRTFDEFADIDITEDMAVSVQVYLDAVRADLAEYPGAELAVEKKFDLSHIFPEMFGTNDASIYIPALAKMIVYDYKHGAGVPVSAIENPQMLYYATGALTGMNNRPVFEIELVIVQPRCDFGGEKVKRWKTDPAFLTDWIGDLIAGAKRAIAPDAPRVPGSWCRSTFCAARPTCKALKTDLFKVVPLDSPAGLPDPKNLTREEVAMILDRAADFESFLSSLREYALEAVKQGEEIPNYMLADKRAMRQWHDENEVIREMGKIDIVGADLYAPAKLKSPAQMEKTLAAAGTPKAKIAEIIGALCSAVSSGVTLVRVDSGRKKPAKIGTAGSFIAIENNQKENQPWT